MKLKRGLCLVLSGFVCLVVLLFPASSITQSAKESATVQVDCTRGQSINKALDKHPKAKKLIVEITGMCQENLVITRDGVTLRGTDPANDGIQGVEDEEITDPALWVRGATLVTLENLKFTGGFSGVLATNANLPDLRLTNCRLEGNRTLGLQLENSLAFATDTTFDSAAGGTPAGVFQSSRLLCTRCTLTAPSSGTNAVVIVNSAANFNQQCSFTGGVRVESSFLSLSDSAIDALAPNQPSINASSNSNLSLIRVQMHGKLNILTGTNAILLAVTQSPSSTNTITDTAHVSISHAGQPTGGPPNIYSTLGRFELNNFSTLNLVNDSTIGGDLICRGGSDASCGPTANVLGISNCGNCPKP